MFMNCTIKTFANRTEAELVKGFLKTNGITSYLQTDDAGQMYPQLARIAGIKLVVAYKDREEAIRLLKIRL